MIIEKGNGTVVDIKRFAVHDGDGIRTTVFLKGCPLQCVWCHNPESISPLSQLAYYRDKCVACGRCVGACPNRAHAVADGVHTLDRDKCVACGNCVTACHAGALEMEGKAMTVAQVMATVMADKLFYDTSGGGMTISGGEPTVQAGFTLALLKAAKAAGIHTALDTCGFVSQEILAQLLPWVDVFLFDIKHITDEGHRRCTGQPNARVLENLRFLSDNGAAIEIRMPLVPTYNDDEATLHGIGALLSGVHITKMKLLAYHAYARSKYAALDMPNTLPAVDRPTKEHMTACADILRGYGLTVITE